MVMVDWLSCRVPVCLPEPIAGGHTVVLAQDGSVDRVTPHRLKVPGSHASSIQIRSVDRSELEIQGNPAKWLSGHNLWGLECPVELLRAFLARLWPLLGLDPAEVLPGPLADLSGVVFTRVDLTAMWALATQGEVLAWLRSAQHLATIPHRGRGVFREGSLVLGSAKGKSFTTWQVVCYSKGQEVQAHPLPDCVRYDDELAQWVSRQLRVELRLGRLELARSALRNAQEWSQGLSRMVYQDKLKLVSFQEGSSWDVSSLPRELRSTFRGWLIGDDLRQEMSRPTFYRHRAALKRALNVDINIPPPPRPVSNVVPFHRVLEARPSGRPVFADRIDRIISRAAS